MLQIPPDYTMLVTQAGIIIALWIVLGRLWFGPALRLIRERRARSEGALEQARTVQAEAEALRARHAAAVEQARAEAQRAMEDLLRDANAEQRRLIAEARADARSMLADVRTRIAEDVAAARRGLRDQADEIAREVARKVLGRAA